MSKRYSLLMIVSSKKTLLIILLKVHGVSHSRHNSPVCYAKCIRSDCPYSNYRVWPFLIGLELLVCLVVFQRPFLRLILRLGMYAALQVHCASLPVSASMTLYTTVASWSLSVLFRYLGTALAFAFLGISVRTVGIPISVGMMVSIQYVRANGGTLVDFRLVVL